MTVVVSTVDDHSSDVSHTQGGPFNDGYVSQNLHWGTHKSGLPQEPLLRFKGLNIPAGATITTASIEQESIIVTSGLGTFNGRIARLTADGKWNASSLLAGWIASISDDDWHVELLDVATQLVIVGVAAQAGSGPNVNGDNGTIVQRVAQGTLITTAGDITIARVALGGSFSFISGDIWIELWSDSSGLPDAILATSDTRPIGDIVFKVWNQLRPTYDFTFSAPEQITVAVNDLIHVVLRNDQVGGFPPHLGTFRYNYTDGPLTPYGISPEGGYDTQNYLTIDDLSTTNKIPTAGSTVAWNNISLSLGLQTTPDISSLVQAHIDSVGYNPIHQLGIRYERVTSNGGIIYAGFGHATAMLTTITVDFTEPSSTRKRVRIAS